MVKRFRLTWLPLLGLLPLLGCARNPPGVPTVTAVQRLAVPADLRDGRYCEVIPVFRRGLQLQAEVYNTIGLNDCPAELWSRLDAQQLARRYGALRVKLNGPRFWLMNRIEALAGSGLSRSVAFDGLQMRQRATITLPPWRLLAGEDPYAVTRVKRSTVFVFRRGEVVYELVSDTGAVYRMQSYARIVDPDLKAADLPGLGARLKLPPGWRYRSRSLSRDSPLRAEGLAEVLQDELQNSYQKLAPGES